LHSDIAFYESKQLTS